MSAPNPCPECDGSGWVMYAAETIEGEEEWAWGLCPECVGGGAFPPKEGEVSVSRFKNHSRPTYCRKSRYTIFEIPIAVTASTCHCRSCCCEKGERPQRLVLRFSLLNRSNGT